MTLAKGSCIKNSHFLRFRRFRRFRRFCGFAVCSPQLVIFLLPCLKSWIPRLRPSWRHFLVRVLINAVKNTASSQSSTNRFLYEIKEFFSEAISQFLRFTRKLNVNNNNDESAFASTL